MNKELLSEEHEGELEKELFEKLPVPLYEEHEPQLGFKVGLVDVSQVVGNKQIMLEQQEKPQTSSSPMKEVILQHLIVTH